MSSYKERLIFFIILRISIAMIDNKCKEFAYGEEK